MERAYNFAKDNRALGLGVLGWHSLLQSKMLPLDSQKSYDLNSEIFRVIKEKSYKASEELAEKFGEPEILKGYGRRNATLNAIAPTTSSAFILGQVSQGIEPIWSNVYVKDIAKIYKEHNGDMVAFLRKKADPIVDPSQYNVMETNFAILKTMSDEELKSLEAYMMSTIK